MDLESPVKMNAKAENPATERDSEASSYLPSQNEILSLDRVLKLPSYMKSDMRCDCAECREGDALPIGLQGWPGAWQMKLIADSGERG